ncbi:hypothetical protein F5144DRAFT_289077 [Chaetomium tenue]|uniref:Uncharacterized protein n=1 Tax=Chaetomium tenue TaxID=1854479 RepID=A0ACB7P1U5_9PEZI|nr:hypothetical protein F5144DRAFT_289077 [Chaetomium globosum]
MAEDASVALASNSMVYTSQPSARCLPPQTNPQNRQLTPIPNASYHVATYILAEKIGTSSIPTSTLLSAHTHTGFSNFTQPRFKIQRAFDTALSPTSPTTTISFVSSPPNHWQWHPVLVYLTLFSIQFYLVCVRVSIDTREPLKATYSYFSSSTCSSRVGACLPPSLLLVPLSSWEGCIFLLSFSFFSVRGEGWGYPDAREVHLFWTWSAGHTCLTVFGRPPLGHNGHWARTHIGS